MMMNRRTKVSITFALVFLKYLIPLSFVICDPLAINQRNRGGSEQQQSIKRFYDNLILKPRDYKLRATSHSTTGNRKRRSVSTSYTSYKLPADEILRSKYYSEKVEEDLGRVRLQRIRRNHPNNSSEQLRYTAPIPQPPSEMSHFQEYGQKMIPNIGHDEAQSNSLNKQRAQDLEEVFVILAKRNGPILEQMLSLRDAIDKYYGIFEFMGVNKLPPTQRDAAIRKIFERALEVDVENAVKRARLH